MFEKFYVGLDLTSSENNGKLKPISRVTLLVDDDNSYTAGDDTGTELTANCAHATQYMADAILAQLRGYQYQAYSADNTNIDPAAELGDAVTADGIYSVISRMSDDGSGYVGLSAPGEAELEDEYPTAGPMTQEFNRKIAQTRSSITKTAEQIRLEVQNEMEELSSSFSVQLDSITARVEGAEGNYTELKQTVDGFTVTDESGTTKISGSSIETDTLYVNAANISGTLTAGQINLSGAITIGDFSSDLQSDISSALEVSDTVEGWRYGSTTYLDGSKLMTGTVVASYLKGGTVDILSSAGYSVGVITPTWSSSSSIALQLASNGALRLGALNGAAFLFAGGTTTNPTSFLQCASDDNQVSCKGDFVPAGNWYCGTSDAAWYGIHSFTDLVVTSDRRKKHDISYDLAQYDAFFDSLCPTSFRLNNAADDCVHLGMVAQDVEDSITACGLSAEDLGAFVKTETEDGFNYALRYGEFIALCIRQIQLLKERVSILEGQT